MPAEHRRRQVLGGVVEEAVARQVVLRLLFAASSTVSSSSSSSAVLAEKKLVGGSCISSPTTITCLPRNSDGTASSSGTWLASSKITTSNEVGVQRQRVGNAQRAHQPDRLEIANHLPGVAGHQIADRLVAHRLAELVLQVRRPWLVALLEFLLLGGELRGRQVGDLQVLAESLPHAPADLCGIRRQALVVQRFQPPDVPLTDATVRTGRVRSSRVRLFPGAMGDCRFGLRSSHGSSRSVRPISAGTPSSSLSTDSACGTCRNALCEWPSALAEAYSSGKLVEIRHRRHPARVAAAGMRLGRRKQRSTIDSAFGDLSSAA